MPVFVIGVVTIGVEMCYRRTPPKKDMLCMFQTSFPIFSLDYSAKDSSLKDPACSIQGIKDKQNKHIVLGRDFSLPHINWYKKFVRVGSNQQIQHQQLLDMAQEHGLEQVQLTHSREGNILDMYFATYPSLVISCETVPGTPGHHMVVAYFDVEPRYNKPTHRELYIYKDEKCTTIEYNR